MSVPRTGESSTVKASTIEASTGESSTVRANTVEARTEGRSGRKDRFWVVDL